MYRKKRTDEERFWSKVDKRGRNECWLWRGTMSNNGYGTFRLGSLTDGSRRNVSAHRYVCEIVHGIKPAQQALHHCDNKQCVNPSHLYAGTPADNSRDAIERGLWTAGGPVMVGENNPRAKLKVADIIAIRASQEMKANLARRYGVSKTQIGWIKARKSWAHVP